MMLKYERKKWVQPMGSDRLHPIIMLIFMCLYYTPFIDGLFYAILLYHVMILGTNQAYNGICDNL